MLDNSKVKILVCCHKPCELPQDKKFLPIHVGAAISKAELGIQRDDQFNGNPCDNISDKNRSFCELTGIYWAWKNLKDVSIIGLCHYRRYFDFHKQVPFGREQKQFKSADFKKLNLDIPDKIFEKVENGSIIVPSPIHYDENIAINYCTHHISDDFATLRKFFFETQPPYMQKAFYQVFFRENYLIPCNMCIMRKADFDEYCSWLFDIIFALEKKIDITHYTPVQQRIYGYIAERLFNVWLYTKRSKVIQKPLLFISDDPPVHPQRPLLNQFIRNFKIDLGLKLVRRRLPKELRHLRLK